MILGLPQIFQESTLCLGNSCCKEHEPISLELVTYAGVSCPASILPRQTNPKPPKPSVSRSENLPVLPPLELIGSFPNNLSQETQTPHPSNDLSQKTRTATSPREPVQGMSTSRSLMILPQHTLSPFSSSSNSEISEDAHYLSGLISAC